MNTSMADILEELPRAPRFLAYRTASDGSDNPACAAIAKEYTKLALAGKPTMEILPFKGVGDLTYFLRKQRASLHEVVLMCPQPDARPVRYGTITATEKTPEIAWVPWRWGVGISPVLHDPRKIKDREQTAKSILFTYGERNFLEAYQSGKLPYGSHPAGVCAKVLKDAALKKCHFHGTFVVSEPLKVLHGM